MIGSGHAQPTPGALRELEVINIRKNVLRGYFNDYDPSAWRSPQWKLLVFVSSTFTDTNLERNILMSNILPHLREEGQKDGIEVTFVDMRWGVRDENTLDHRTWIECSRELERCKRESSGLFFLSLQSDKYGYVSLPRNIPRTVLDERLATCSANILQLAGQWYHVDRNAVPEEYILKPLSSMADDSFWKEALPQLSEALDGLKFSQTCASQDCDSELLVGRSVTEWETKAALSDSPSCKRACWMERIFPLGVSAELDPLKHFDDTVEDATRKVKINNLKDFMHRKLPPNKLRKYRIDFAHLVHRDNEWEQHISKWTDDVMNVLTDSLNELTELRHVWDVNGCGIGIPGNHLNEMLHHSSWAVEKCSTFQGREGLINTALIALADKAIVSVMNKLELLNRIRKRSFRRPDRSAIVTNTNNDSLERLFGKARLTRVDDKILERKESDQTVVDEVTEIVDGILVVRVKKDSPRDAQKRIQFRESKPGDLESPRGLTRSKSSLERVLDDAGAETIAGYESQGSDRDSPRESRKHDSLDSFAYYDEDIELDSGDDDEESYQDQYHDEDEEEDVLYATNPWLRLKLGIMLNIEDLLKIFQELKESFDKSAVKVNNLSFHRSTFFSKAMLRTPRSNSPRVASPRAGSPRPSSPRNSTTPRGKPVVSKFSFSSMSTGLDSNSPRGKVIRPTNPKFSSSKGRETPRETSPKSNVGHEGLRRMARSSIKFSELHSTSSIQRRSSLTLHAARDGYNGISLCIVGLSGAGKTALMAKLASEIARNQIHKNRLVIIRFCGTSPGSTNGHSLVRSICHQIELGAGLPYNKKLEVMKYADIVSYFHGLMQTHPVVLLIDSLDQLSDADLARSDISFLKGIALHPRSRIIVSTLPDERNSDSGEWIYYYGCESKLRAAGIKMIQVAPFQQSDIQRQTRRGNMHKADSGSTEGAQSAPSSPGPRIPPLKLPSEEAGFLHHGLTSSNHIEKSEVVAKLTGDNEGISMMKSMLWKRGRTLTPVQWSYVVDQASKEATALYLWLAVRVVEKWVSTSVVNVDVRLAPGVKPLINQIFDEVERNYGRELTRVAIGFITFSVSGVSDAEMEDLLSLDNEVMASVNQYCQDAQRLPSHVWLRLRSVVYGLVTEREGGCLGWYHRQLRETAEARYSKADRLKLHILMAKYYGGIFDEDTIARTGISRQPLIHNSTNSMSVWLPKARINSRRCEEAAPHMINAKMYEEVVKELCNIESVVARVKTGQGFALITQLSKVAKHVAGDSLVDHYYRWIRRDIHLMLSNPTLAVTLTCGKQPLSSLARRDLELCMRQYYTTKFVTEASVEAAVTARRPSLTTGVSMGPLMPESVNQSNLWIRGRSLGGEHDFDLLQSILQSHTENVSCVCYNSDGSRIASASWDRSVKIWDSSIGNILCTLEGHGDSVMSVAFNAEGTLIVTGSEDRTVRLWDAVVGSVNRILEGHTSCVNSACFSPDSMVIASGSNDNTIKLWDALDGSCTLTLDGHTNNVSAVRISYDGIYLASASHDNTIRLWYCGDGKLKSVLQGHTDRVNDVCFSFDNKMLVSGSDDETVRTWDVATGNSINFFEGQHDPVPSVCISSDNTIIVSGAWDSTIRVWDPVTGQLFCSLDGHTGSVNSVCMVQNGETIVSGSEDKTVRIWDVNVWYGDRSMVVGHSGYVTSSCFSYDGNLIVTGSEDKTVKIWNTALGDMTKSLDGHTGDVTSVAICKDGDKIVSGATDQSLRVWSVSTGTMLVSIKHRFDQPYVCFHPDGQHIASASWGYAIRIWDLSGTIINAFKGHTGDVTSVMFNSDGSRLISGSCDSSVFVWDVASACCLHFFTGHEKKVTSVSWCADESLIASGSEDMNVIIWDWPSRCQLFLLKGHTDIVTSVSFSSDGSSVVSGSWDFTVRVWDVVNGLQLFCLEGHTNRVNCVHFSTDGTKIVSSSDDKSILVWDASTGARMPMRAQSKKTISSWA